MILGTGFAGLSIVLMIVLLTVDFAIYYPFFKAYDNELLVKEKEIGHGDQLESTTVKPAVVSPAFAKQKNDQTNVLVLCANGATSSMLANAIKKGAK